jgi:hypothetical protein
MTKKSIRPPNFKRAKHKPVKTETLEAINPLERAIAELRALLPENPSREELPEDEQAVRAARNAFLSAMGSNPGNKISMGWRNLHNVTGEQMLAMLDPYFEAAMEAGLRASKAEVRRLKEWLHYYEAQCASNDKMRGRIGRTYRYGGKPPPPSVHDCVNALAFTRDELRDMLRDSAAWPDRVRDRIERRERFLDLLIARLEGNAP